MGSVSAWSSWGRPGRHTICSIHLPHKRPAYHPNLDDKYDTHRRCPICSKRVLIYSVPVHSHIEHIEHAHENLMIIPKRHKCIATALYPSSHPLHVILPSTANPSSSFPSTAYPAHQHRHPSSFSSYPQSQYPNPSTATPNSLRP
jgi:hypothetical protein